MSNPNEDSKETQFSSTFARYTAGQLTTDEQKALTEHQDRGSQWAADGTRRSSRTSSSNQAASSHTMMHDSENKSCSSSASGRASNEMDGPPETQRNQSDSSDLSLPPQPETQSWSSISDHSDDEDPSLPEKSPPKRLPGGRTESPPPRNVTQTSTTMGQTSQTRQYGTPFHAGHQDNCSSQGTKAQAARLTPISEVPHPTEDATVNVTCLLYTSPSPRD